MGTTSLMTELSPSSVIDQIGGWGGIKVLLGSGPPNSPTLGSQAGPPCHGLGPAPPRTHSAWCQGIGSTLELASRCGL